MQKALYVHGRSDVGRHREQNEDSMLVRPFEGGAWLLAVCDGMGGHEAGELASAAAVARLDEVMAARPHTEPFADIYAAIVEANRAVMEEAERERAPSMGTTAVVAWVEPTGRCWVGWVGDSRLYHLRSGLRLDTTVDHTRVQAMVEMGILRPEEAAHHPDSHVLIQALGGGPDAQSSFQPTVWDQPLELETGDVLVLCSDGLHDLVDGDEIWGIIEGADCTSAVERLIDEALSRGGHDNVTVVIAVVGQPDVPVREGRRVECKPPMAPEEERPGTAVYRSERSAEAGTSLLTGLLLGLVVGFALGVAVGLFLGGDSDEPPPPPPPPPPAAPAEPAP